MVRAAAARSAVVLAQHSDVLLKDNSTRQLFYVTLWINYIIDDIIVIMQINRDYEKKSRLTHIVIIATALQINT